MAGHNKWKQIKTRKEAQDKKKSQAFSKILTAISIAAREEANPELNPRLRTLIEKAKTANVPKENITRALSRAGEAKELKEVIIEAYGPDGAALLIEAITDNSNRTIAEVKKILAETGAKFANPGSVQWAFGKNANREFFVKFPQPISPASKELLAKIIEAVELHPDVQLITTNAEI